MINMNIAQCEYVYVTERYDHIVQGLRQLFIQQQLHVLDNYDVNWCFDELCDRSFAFNQSTQWEICSLYSSSFYTKVNWYSKACG